MGSTKKEVIQGNKKIIYKICMTDDKEFKGIEVNILDLTKPIPDTRYLSINPAEYVPNIATNFNPNANSHPIDGALDVPAVCYTIDSDIRAFGFDNKIKGDYLGNIVVNTPNGKQGVCFISQDRDSKQRYYKFVDLTFGNILACTEWDLDWEYLGMPSDEEGHQEYLRQLREMKPEFEFTTQIGCNSEEKLIDYNGEGLSEEGIKKYGTFKRNLMDILDNIYALEQMKPSIEENRDREIE